LSCCFAFGWVAGDPRAARGAVVRAERLEES
jgi:hypothetical protein